MAPGCAWQTRNTGLDPVGTYKLIRVDDRDVPCPVQHGGQSLIVESGVFVFESAGAGRSRIGFVGPGGGKVRREVRATYRCRGATLKMKWKGAGMTTGTLDGDTFTMNNEGMKFFYRRVPQ